MFSVSVASVVCHEKKKTLLSGFLPFEHFQLPEKIFTSPANMGKDSVCRICEKKHSPNFANLFDSKVKVYDCADYLISYFEAIQQLTGMEVRVCC